MGGIRPYPLVAIILILGTVCLAQPASSITNPELQLKDNQIHIIYDILNSDTTDLYNVRLEITDSAGNIIGARTFEGDVGANVTGGKEKCIIWSFQADNIHINGDLYIQIYASESKKEYSRTSLVLQSLVFPGLGLTRLKGGPHWLKGIAGYGCLAGAVLMNRMAISTYEDYKNPGSAENASTLLEQSGRQDNISEALAFAAIGIWITDQVWTILGSSEMKRDKNLTARKKINIGTGYDPNLHMPMLSLRYRF